MPQRGKKATVDQTKKINVLYPGLQHLGSPGYISRILGEWKTIINVPVCLQPSRNPSCMVYSIIQGALQACARDQGLILPQFREQFLNKDIPG